MVLAMGKFQVSKYAAPTQGGAGALDFGIPTTGGNQFGGLGGGQLIPSNVFPNTILPGGEVIPGGGSPFLPGGVPMDPAYAGPGTGPLWDKTTGPWEEGGNPRARTFGSRIINVNLPKMITAGQPFPIIVTYVHQGDSFATYKIQVNIPIFQITETSQEKRIANNGQDNIIVNLTAPIPLPDAPVTGTVSLIQTEGNDITVDSEIFTIPTEKVPNPPPIPPPDMPPGPGGPPIPEPEPSPPPVMPPPPPVPIPPVLQLIPVTITRGQDGGFQSIVIEASNLEASEPTTVFIYLSQRGNRGKHKGWDRDGREHDDNDHDRDNDRDNRWRNRIVSAQTPAGSVATANIAYSYPATVSINGITSAGNGLRLTNMPSVSSIQNQVRSQINQTYSRTRSRLPPAAPIIQNLVSERLKEQLRIVQPGRVEAAIVQMTAANPPRAIQLRQEIEERVREQIADVMENVSSGNGTSASAGGAGGGAIATAGPNAIAVGEPNPSGPIIDPRQIPRPEPPVFKRQRVSLTASDAGTVRHVVRIQSASQTSKLNGYVLVYGHRSKKHSGRKPFSL